MEYHTDQRHQKQPHHQAVPATIHGAVRHQHTAVAAVPRTGCSSLGEERNRQEVHVAAAVQVVQQQEEEEEAVAVGGTAAATVALLVDWAAPLVARLPWDGELGHRHRHHRVPDTDKAVQEDHHLLHDRRRGHLLLGPAGEDTAVVVTC